MRWLKFLKDYDFGLNYHPGEVNVVIDALSWKSLHMTTMMVIELDLIKQFRDLSLVCDVTLRNVCLGMLKLTNIVLKEIREGQKWDLRLIDRLVLINQGKEVDFRVDENGITKFCDVVCVPDMPELRKVILEESHMSSLSIHPGATKIYQYLKKFFWWPGMKKDIAEFIYACLTCQKSKVEHHKSSGLMQPLSIPEWKWDNIFMDFMTDLIKTPRGSDSICVVVVNWLIQRILFR